MDIVFIGAVLLLEAFDIQAGLTQSVNEGFDSMSFAVAGRTNEEDATLPRDIVGCISGARGEELGQVVMDILLECTLQDQVVEGGVLDGVEEVFVFVPAAVIENKNFTTHLDVPIADSDDKLPSDLFG